VKSVDIPAREYFRTDLGVLYCGDCLEVLPRLEPKSVDLVVTDPPYGMRYRSNRYKEENPFGFIANDERFPSEIIALLKRLARKAVFVFCRWENLIDLGARVGAEVGAEVGGLGCEDRPKSFIVWVKNSWTAGDLAHEYGRMWEGILFYPLEEHAFRQRLPDVIDCRRVPPGRLYHPTEKPVYLLRWLIENNTATGDIVLDPFIGSGTTAVACEQLGRRWIGIEISEEYCEIAKRRISAEAAQLKLDLDGA